MTSHCTHPVCRSLYAALRMTCLLVAAHWSSEAAEIELPETVSVRGSIVRLGDIATIRSDDVSELKLLRGLPLATSPARDESRRFSVSEIAQLLSFSGVDPRGCKFCGSEWVLVRSETEPTWQSHGRPGIQQTVAVATSELRPILAGDIADPLVSLQQALESHIHKQVVPAVADVQVKVQVSPRVRQQLAGAKLAGISGGRAPWSGSQIYQVQLAGLESQPLSVQVETTLLVDAVVALRELSPGEILTAADCEARLVPQTTEARDFAAREQLLGAEVVRTIKAGQPLPVSAVRRPRLVLKGEEIRIASVAQGVSVVEFATALSNGAFGEMVPVETLVGKRKFSVRVIGPQQGAIYALPTTLPESSPPKGQDAFQQR
jgi:flagella basal body P-ring formation protein FlgA